MLICWRAKQGHTAMYKIVRRLSFVLVSLDIASEIGNNKTCRLWTIELEDQRHSFLRAIISVMKIIDVLLDNK